MKFLDEQFLENFTIRFGKPTARQTEGLKQVLRLIEQSTRLNDLRDVAYLLATIRHETAYTYRPIFERGQRSYFDKYNAGTKLGKALGNTQPGDGYRFRGRGYVQITGRANYLQMGKLIGRDLVANPDDACLPDVAMQIAIVGMSEGRFTGMKLRDYLNAKKTDYLNARRVINGLDRAAPIAAAALAFEEILERSTLTPTK